MTLPDILYMVLLIAPLCRSKGDWARVGIWNPMLGTCCQVKTGTCCRHRHRLTAIISQGFTVALISSVWWLRCCILSIPFRMALLFYSLSLYLKHHTLLAYINSVYITAYLYTNISYARFMSTTAYEHSSCKRLTSYIKDDDIHRLDDYCKPVRFQW